MFKADIKISLRPSILDPQGKAVQHALASLGFDDVSQVRMGKHAELWLDVETEVEARARAQEACSKLLANPVMEDFEIQISTVEAVAG